MAKRPINEITKKTMQALTPGWPFCNRAQQAGQESPRESQYLSDGLDAGFRGRGCECLNWESISTTLSCFQDAATSRAVWPVGPRISGFRSLRSNSDFTIATCPNCAAHQSGVPPHLESSMLGLISFRFNSNPTTPGYHWCTAHKRGVRPYSVSAVSIIPPPHSPYERCSPIFVYRVGINIHSFK